MSITLDKPLRSARKAKGDGHLRRAEILQAAERIFLRDGYQGATIRKIADEVGVSSTALYMHFRDKDEILLEICDGAVGALLAVNTEIAERPIDPVSRLRMMLEAFLRFGLENPSTYWLTFCSPCDVAAVRRTRASELGARCFERFRAPIEEIAALGRLRSDVNTAAQVLWSSSHGFISMRIGRPHYAWSSDETLINGLLDSLLHGQVLGA